MLCIIMYVPELAGPNRRDLAELLNLAESTYGPYLWLHLCDYLTKSAKLSAKRVKSEKRYNITMTSAPSYTNRHFNAAKRGINAFTASCDYDDEG